MHTASTKSPGSAAPAPKKSLGQHFLRNADICRRIATLAELQDQDRVLEIGPGPGALTQVIETLPHETLLLQEKDSYWAGVREAEAEARTRVICMDALAFRWEDLEGPWKIMGNLPYNVASPLIWDVAARARAMLRAVFMIQKEVGERLCAHPGTRDYGALSVWVQAFWQARFEFVVRPGAFAPPPKVDSAVCSFEPKDVRPDEEQAKRLSRVIKLCFGQRRKQLGGTLRKAGQIRLLEGLEARGIALSARAEELSVEDYLFLSAF